MVASMEVRSVPDQIEQKLILGCLNGQRMAQKRLYDKYVQAMYNTIVRIVGDASEAEDVLQETFVNVFRKLQSFKGESTLGAWIKRIAINQSLNAVRARKAIYFENIETSYIELEGKHINETENSRQLDMKEIHHAIKELPEGCRVIFSLYLLEGYQHQEIAEILNVSESTSKSQYQRARKLLQAALKQKISYD